MSGMNESNTLYRLFINFCVTLAIGFIVLLAEYTALGEAAVDLKILWYIVASGVVVGLVFEVLFVNVFPLSGNHLRRNILWRNRMICAIVNAAIVSILGKIMLGSGLSLTFLLLMSIALCVVAVIIGGIISDIRSKRSIKEMNRRLQLLRNLKGAYDPTDGE